MATVQRHVPPKPLGGAWQATADCSGGEMLRLEFRPEAVQAAGSFGETSCAYAGLRQMTRRGGMSISIALGAGLSASISTPWPTDGCWSRSGHWGRLLRPSGPV